MCGTATFLAYQPWKVGNNPLELLLENSSSLTQSAMQSNFCNFELVTEVEMIDLVQFFLREFMSWQWTQCFKKLPKQSHEYFILILASKYKLFCCIGTKIQKYIWIFAPKINFIENCISQLIWIFALKITFVSYLIWIVVPKKEKFEKYETFFGLISNIVMVMSHDCNYKNWSFR